MNSDLEKLLALERADREIARLSQEIAGLPRKVAAIEQKLHATQAQLEGARAALKNGEAQRRKLETEILGAQQKISKYRDQSLDVKTNEQYKALLHEIGFAEKDIRECEDKILEFMVGAETQEKVARQAEAELKEETAEIERETAAARAVTAEDEKLLASLSAQRDQLRTGIDDDGLRHYDRVFKLRGNPLAEARDHKCMGCQVMLRPQTYSDVRSNEHLLTCDSCHRILWYDTSRDAQPAVEAGAS